MSSEQNGPRRGALDELLHALASWRTLSVGLLSFSSGLPLGLVWLAIPEWMTRCGFDIRIVGLFTLAHAPWMFKILWAPFMDRFSPPFLGRRRGWMLVAQVALFALTLMLAGVGDHPETPWVVLALALALAFASASQDIVIDAYAVDVLRRDEQGMAVGLRIGAYRAAMLVAGGGAMAASAYVSWPLVNALLALLYLPMMLVTVRAREPADIGPGPATIREAVWSPFLGFLGKHRALEILGFVLLYKLADNLAQSLQRPFLAQMGYSELDTGLAVTTLGFAATFVGTMLGGATTTTLGLGHSLWIFGLVQIFSNVGFILVSQSEVNRPLMYGAMGFESFSTGLGMGAFGVLLLRLTQKRFSATQYALFSSIFGLPRMAAGPITGVVVHSLGWTTFFWLTPLAGIPGLLMLARFVPIGTRDPEFTVEPPRYREPLTTAGLGWRGIGGGLVGCAVGLAAATTLDALEGLRETPESGFIWLPRLVEIVSPQTATDWIAPVGILVFGAACALITAAIFAARHSEAPAEHD